MTESLWARVPALTRSIGPIAAARMSLASRYANILRCGQASEPGALSGCRLILIQAPAEDLPLLADLLPPHECPVALVDEDFSTEAPSRLYANGGGFCSVGVAPAAAGPALLLDGDAPAVRAVRVWAGEAGVRCVDLNTGGKGRYGAGILIAASLVTPLVDASVRCLRAAGLTQVESRRIVAQALAGALRSFDAHGRKSWPNPANPVRQPSVLAQQEELAATDSSLEKFLSRTLRACLEYYGQETDWLH